MQKFFDDMGVNMSSDVVTMLIFHKMNAQNMGIITLPEFKTGLTALGVSTTEELKKKLPQLYQELRDQ